MLLSCPTLKFESFVSEGKEVEEREVREELGWVKGVEAKFDSFERRQRRPAEREWVGTEVSLTSLWLEL